MILRQIKDLTDLEKFAKEIAHEISEDTRIYMTGKLGAGKTTLTKKILLNTGIIEREVKSPTYTIKKSYNSNLGLIHHLDLYRLEEIDLEELMDENGAYIIEWADKIPNCKKQSGLHIDININEDESRTIRIVNVAT